MVAVLLTLLAITATESCVRATAFFASGYLDTIQYQIGGSPQVNSACFALGHGSTQYEIGRSNQANTAACRAYCTSQGNCQSYTFSQTNECYTYTAPLSMYFTLDSASQYYFYDLACTPCNIPGSGSTQYLIGRSSQANSVACRASCTSQGNCKSYAFGQPYCYTYTAPPLTSLIPNSASQYYFSDLVCTSCYTLGNAGNQYWIGSSIQATIAACRASCTALKNCQSYAFGQGKCYTYSTSVSAYIILNPGSSFLFFDLAC
jgi:hypothetical protein